MIRARFRRIPAAAAVALGLGAFCASASASVTVSQSGWAWGNPTPQGNNLRDIDFLGGAGYAVGDSGTALRTNDAGTTWSGLATGTGGALDRLQIVDANTIVVGGGDGCVLRRSADGGKSFSKIFVPTETDCPDRVRSFSFVDAQNGYLLLRDGSVLATHDGGASFSRLTAIPGTPAATGGGNQAAEDIHFTSASTGVAFITTAAGSGSSSAFTTTDGAVSWKPAASVGAGTVTRLYFFDKMNAYAIGPSTLQRSTDGGNNWSSRPAGAGQNLTSIRCSDPLTCLLTVKEGDKILRTTDGGASAFTPISASSGPIFSAAFATPSRAVAVGANGTTVVSNDGGVNYSPVSADIGGQFSRLRSGPGSIVLAPGAKGVFARSSDGGVTWKSVATQTSADLKDVSFDSPTDGFALGVNGGLQHTSNGGNSWSTLDPGSSVPAQAVAAVGSNVLLIGPVGIRIASNGGRFSAVPGKALKKTALNDVDVVGSTIVAFGSRSIVESLNGGSTFSAVKVPTTRKKGRARPVSIRSVAFTTANSGYVLDTAGRVFSTQTRGRRWTEISSTGSGDGLSLAFANPAQGFMSLGAYGKTSDQAFILRTSDAGKSWRPQLISMGTVGSGGIVATSGADAYALVIPGGSGPALGRELFFTHSGGDAGAPSQLAIAGPKSLTRKSLKKAKGKVTITGTLAGAQGGEQIVVSARPQKGGTWTHKVVTAGANNGSYTATFPITRSTTFVSQWAGDSNRQSAATGALTVKVK